MTGKAITGMSFDMTPLGPAQLFDNFYFVGTRSVGSFLVNTKDGLIMIDTGWGGPDTVILFDGMRKLGLDPSKIKLILLSHEHLDHYGGVPYFKKNVCPGARVAMSVIAWNLLHTRPAGPPGGPYSEPRPQSIDVFLQDGQTISLGKTGVQIVATPGHTHGCISFIVPVTDNGKPHMVGMMGGVAFTPEWDKAYLYKASIEYFQQFTRKAKCDAGVVAHFSGYEEDLNALRSRKPGQPNPLVIGTERFESEYLQQFRDNFEANIKKMPPEVLSIPAPPWIK